MNCGAVPSVDKFEIVDLKDLSQCEHVFYTCMLHFSHAPSDVVYGVLELMQHLIPMSPAQRPSVSIFTLQVHAVEAYSSEVCNSWGVGGMLSGMCASIRHEIPEISLQLVDLDTNGLHSCARYASIDKMSRALRKDVYYEQKVVLQCQPTRLSCPVAPLPMRSYIHKHTAAAAVQLLTEGSEMALLDADRLRAYTAAQEALARNFLWAAMDSMSMSDVYHEHHRKLWNRWYAKLFADEENHRDSDLTCEAIETEYPDMCGALTMLARCGPEIAAVFSGQQDPLSLLFPHGTMDAAEAVYAQTTSARFFNLLVRTAVQSLVHDAVQEQGSVMLMEIGGGTGATTSDILPVVSIEECQYYFTDLSDAFLRRAQKKWQMRYPFVLYGIFDVEKHPVGQGYPLHAFDAIVAVNVLHATRHLKQSLFHTNQLLKPGALLVLSEVTEVVATATLDCTWGLTEGWWLFDDGRDFAIQTRECWVEWLQFANFDLLPNALQPLSNGQATLEGQTVFVAHARVNLGNIYCHSTPSSAQLDQSLIIGGLGGIGVITARWLAGLGMANLSLVSRSGIPKDDSSRDHLELLRSYSCLSITIAGCDATHLDKMKKTSLHHCNRLHSIFVATLVSQGSAVSNIDMQLMRSVVSPKLEPLAKIHALCQLQPLHMMVAYSSIAATFGATGDTAYSAASAGMDTFSGYRRGLGLRSMSIQWGFWTAVGSAARYSNVLAARSGQTTGLDSKQSISSSAGVRALATVLTWPTAQVLVFPVDLKHPLIALRKCSATRQPPYDTEASLSRNSLGAPTNPETNITDILTSFVGHSSNASQDDPLDHLLDSLSMLEFRNILQLSYGDTIKLSTTALFEYPTVRALQDHLHLQASASHSRFNPAEAVIFDNECIAFSLAGMACTLSGRTESPAQLWEVLILRAVYISHKPPSHWQHLCNEANAPPSIAFGAFLGKLPWTPCPQVDDHLIAMTKVSADALADAGQCPQDYKHAAVGMFTAATVHCFAVATLPYQVARFVASQLQVSGPYRNVEAACSSAYLAVFHALEALKSVSEDCDMTVVSGASLLQKVEPMLVAHNQGLCSPTGQMLPLSADCDGFVAGEAYGAVVLLRWPQTSCEFSRFIGWAHCANSPLLPAGFVDPINISTAASSALNLAKLSSQNVGITHAHAMGNGASDIPEIMGLIKTIGSDRASPAVLLNHKANLGHSQAASGVIAVITTALAQIHHRVPVHIGVIERIRPLAHIQTLELPTSEPAVLSPGVDASISGTSMSGDTIHLVMQNSGDKTPHLAHAILSFDAGGSENLECYHAGPARQWVVADVGKWLASLPLSADAHASAVASFEEYGITGLDLLEAVVTDRYLSEIGMNEHHSRVILEATCKLQNDQRESNWKQARGVSNVCSIAIQSQNTASAQYGVSVVGMACKVGEVVHNPSSLWSLLLSGSSCLRNLDLASTKIHTGNSGSTVIVHLMHEIMEMALSASLTTVKYETMAVFTAAPGGSISDCVPASMLPRAVAASLKAEGPLLNVDALCSSSYLALDKAVCSLKATLCDSVVIGSMQLLQGVSMAQIDEQLPNMLSKKCLMRPFDTQADGTVLGEGSAAVLLERSASPKYSHANVVASTTNSVSPLLPFGFTDPASMGRAMKDAHMATGKDICSKLAFVHCHGSSCSCEC